VSVRTSTDARQIAAILTATVAAEPVRHTVFSARLTSAGAGSVAR
jgi:hypothetical protein